MRTLQEKISYLGDIKNDIINFNLTEPYINLTEPYINLTEVKLINEFDLLFNEVHGIKISLFLLVTINIVILSFIVYLYFQNLKKIKDKIKYIV